ncbi:MAG: ribonuclease P protein component [Leptolyngbya sp. LCM1.Bin17]|nr:MAG: ribonuclease P protein component [Leptolyngbya sp. LCM1.Bin17]
MLPKHHRLRSSRDFSRVYKHGKKAVSTHLIVRIYHGDKAQSAQAEPSLLPGEAALGPKVGITVSQKVHKRAVVRNRLKRQLKAAFRTLLPAIAPSIWVVINVRPGATQCGYGEFLRELEELLTKLEVIHGHS